MRVANLSADLTANTSQFEIGMRRADGVMRKSQQTWGNSLKQSSRSFDVFSRSAVKSTSAIGAVKGSLMQLGGVTASALSIGSIIKYSDTWKQLQGRLAIVEGSFGAAAEAQEKLFNVSQKTRTSLEAVTNLYTKINTGLTAQEKKQYDVLDITETFAMALANTGETAASAQGAILQFSQAIAGDFKSAGQELNSIIEQAPAVAKALGEAMGVPTAKLKEMAKAGELSKKMVLEALSKDISSAARKIAADFANVPTTVAQALTQVDNAFLRFIGNTEAIQSGTSSIASSLTSLANNFEDVAHTIIAVGAIIGVRAFAPLLAGYAAAARAQMQYSLAVVQGRATALGSASAVASETAAVIVNTKAKLQAVNAQLMYASGTKTLNALSAQRAVLETRLAAATTANSAAISRMGLAARATAGSIGLMNGAMSLVGGPLGAFILGMYGIVKVMQQFVGEVNIGSKAVEAHARALDFISSSKNEYISASNDRRKAIRAETQEYIDNIEQQLLAYSIAASQFNSMSRHERGWGRILGKLGLAQDVAEIEKGAAGLAQALEDMKKLQGDYTVIDLDTSNKKSFEGVDKDAKKRKKTIEGILADLKKEADAAKIKTDMYGKEASAIDKALKKQEIRNKLAEEGIKLSATQQAQMDAYIDSIEMQEAAYDSLEKQEKAREEALERQQDLIDDLGSSFESAFEDAIVNGEKLSDVLNALLQDILKIMIRTQFTSPLIKGVGEGFNEGGIFSNLFGSTGSSGGGSFLDGLWESLPSFDVGSKYVPKDMVANIHKGEMIIPADEAAAMRKGSGSVGSPGVVVNINNNTNSKVSTTSAEGPSGMELTIMIDELTAGNISKTGSRTNQALKGFQSQGYNRR